MIDYFNGQSSRECTHPRDGASTILAKCSNAPLLAEATNPIRVQSTLGATRSLRSIWFQEVRRGARSHYPIQANLGKGS